MNEQVKHIPAYLSVILLFFGLSSMQSSCNGDDGYDETYNSCGEFAVLSFADIEIDPISCFDANDGRISVQVECGTAPINYEWEHGASTSTIDNLKPGKYRLTVSDANLALDTFFVLSQPDSLRVSISIDNTHIKANAIGAKGDVSYAWSDGQSGPQVVRNSKGELYRVTVTDSRGCTATDSKDIPDKVSKPVVVNGRNQRQSKNTNASRPKTVKPSSASEACPGVVNSTCKSKKTTIAQIKANIAEEKKKSDPDPDVISGLEKNLSDQEKALRDLKAELRKNNPKANCPECK